MIRIAEAAEVKEKGCYVTEYAARRIAIFYEDGEYTAVEDICPHMGAFISNGFRQPGLLICPWHNWEFETATGKCTSNSLGKDLLIFKVEIRDGWIYLPEITLENEEESIDW